MRSVERSERPGQVTVGSRVDIEGPAYAQRAGDVRASVGEDRARHVPQDGHVSRGSGQVEAGDVEAERASTSACQSVPSEASCTLNASCSAPVSACT